MTTDQTKIFAAKMTPKEQYLKCIDIINKKYIKPQENWRIINKQLKIINLIGNKMK